MERTKNPDFGDTFPQAIPTLAVGQHMAMPSTDDDVKPDPSKPNNISDLTQAIANTAGFHFAFIEQGGTSFYPTLAQRVTSVEVQKKGLGIHAEENLNSQRRLFPAQEANARRENAVLEGAEAQEL